MTATLLPNTLIFPFSRQWASLLFHRACQKAGITLQLRQGVHSLRHSLAHHLLDAGAPLPVVQKSLRHRSIGSTGVYLEADGASVDSWRAKAIGIAPDESTARAIAHGLSHVHEHSPSTPTLAEIQEEIKRLSALAAAMQAADAPEPAPVAAPETMEATI